MTTQLRAGKIGAMTRRRTAFQPEVPNVARMYDYMLGGKDNFPADRAAARRTFDVLGEDVVRGTVLENRLFLGRAVRHLASDLGIRQFLDIGTGLPTMGNVHEVARSVAPASRVVYVDNDPVVMTHARDMLHGVDGTAIVEHDLRDPGGITGDSRVSQVVFDDSGAVHAVQHVPGVRHHDGIVVDVHHAAGRRHGSGDLVHVPHGGQAGADVEELPDPQVAGQVADGAPEEEPVLENGAAHDVLAEHVERPARRRPVGREVVFPAEHVVIHSRDVRYLRLKRRPPPRHGPDLASAQLRSHRYLYGVELRFSP